MLLLLFPIVINLSASFREASSWTCFLDRGETFLNERFVQIECHILKVFIWGGYIFRSWGNKGLSFSSKILNFSRATGSFSNILSAKHLSEISYFFYKKGSPSGGKFPPCLAQSILRLREFECFHKFWKFSTSVPLNKFPFVKLFQFQKILRTKWAKTLVKSCTINLLTKIVELIYVLPCQFS